MGQYVDLYVAIIIPGRIERLCELSYEVIAHAMYVSLG